MVRASLIRKLESIEDPKLRDVFISFLEEAERIIGETVTRKEFQEFVRTTNENFNRVWKAINELTEAQKRTEQRVNELAIAQKRTEERLNELALAHSKLEQKVSELAEAQKKTEERLNELAEAQKRTEQRVNELAIAQKRTEERLNELALAQKETERELKKLTQEHKKTREHLGGLTNAFGYVLEDRAIKGLPSILKERFNIETIGPLKREMLEIENREIEINIIGKGKQNGKTFTIIGESKAQARKRDIDKFLGYIKLLDRYIPGDKFLVLITYHTSSKVRKYAQEKGVHIIFSYELPLA